MSKKRPDIILVILAVIILAVLAPGITWFVVKGAWTIVKFALIVLAIFIVIMFIVRYKKK